VRRQGRAIKVGAFAFAAVDTTANSEKGRVAAVTYQEPGFLGNVALPSEVGESNEVIAPAISHNVTFSDFPRVWIARVTMAAIRLGQGAAAAPSDQGQV
jgi:hypothetical protein